jgi:hypothetical protein
MERMMGVPYLCEYFTTRLGYHVGMFKALPSLIVLILGLWVGFAVGGVQEAVVVATLVVLEVALSFNNAVINARVLGRMNRFWQRMFLTVGILIAVVGMRLVLPILIVMVTSGLRFAQVVRLATERPELYAERLTAAHPAIAAFGGMFLIMLFLDFVFDESKHVHWIKLVERPLARAGRIKLLPVLIALAGLWLAESTLAGHEAGTVVWAGLAGLATYLGVRALAAWTRRLSPPAGTKAVAGMAGLALFLYLEVLDAAFSFDGVIGAFAITTNVITIALGLGIGAFFVRELTVWLVRHRALERFIYLEHGAQYSVGALAVLLALSLAYEIPDVVTGLVGAGFIAWALVSSLQERRKPHSP